MQYDTSYCSREVTRSPVLTTAVAIIQAISVDFPWRIIGRVTVGRRKAPGRGQVEHHFGHAATVTVPQEAW